MSFRLDYNGSGLRHKLDTLGPKFGAMILMYAATKASEIEYKMRINRPWTDRTGKAKATLSARVSQPNSKLVRITLAHGVDYGIWLELANGKNYAIIAPTVKEEGPRIVEDLDNLMNSLKL